MSSGKVAAAALGPGLGTIFLVGLGVVSGLKILALIMDSADTTSSSGSSYRYDDYEERSRRERERQRREERLRLERIEEERRAREQERLRLERERRIEAERQKMIAQVCARTTQMLQNEISGVKNDVERNQLKSSLTVLESSYRQAISNNDTARAEEIVNNLRHKIISVQADEEALDSQKKFFQDIVSKIEHDASSELMTEIQKMRKESENRRSSLNEQSRKIQTLTARAYKMAQEIAQNKAVSLDGLIEETLFIPPVADKDISQGEAELKISLLQDICDFGSRIEFFNESEADKLKPLIIEAKTGTDAQRLKVIRTQVKTTYGRLREEAVLTAMFKRDIHDFLPPMKKAVGTEKLYLRMEDLLTAPIITREEYNEVYKAVKTVFNEQLEHITDALFAEKIERELNAMGYQLLDENGEPSSLVSGQVSFMSIPDEKDYLVRVRVGENKTISTRLVRVAGSEAEKISTSEYQKQKDIEAGRKWQEKITSFYESLTDEGVQMQITFSEEPGSRPLDVVVNESLKKRHAQKEAVQSQNEQLRTMHIEN